MPHENSTVTQYGLSKTGAGYDQYCFLYRYYIYTNWICFSIVLLFLQIKTSNSIPPTSVESISKSVGLYSAQNFYYCPFQGYTHISWRPFQSNVPPKGWTNVSLSTLFFTTECGVLAIMDYHGGWSNVRVLDDPFGGFN